MTSCASLIKSNKTRQGDTLQMHRRGDVAAKQVEKVNKTKKKRRRKKKDSAAPARSSAQPMDHLQTEAQESFPQPNSHLPQNPF
jgi:hypothetical protein